MHEEILSNITITDIYSISTIYSAAHSKMRQKLRLNWALVLKHDGESTYTTKNNTYVSNINNMVILTKGSSYEWICTKPGNFTIIEFECPLFFDEIISFPNVNGKKFLDSFKSLEHIYNSKPPLYKLKCINGIYNIIISLAASSQNKYIPTKYQQIILPATQFINDNYNQKITNNDLADMCSLSTTYFRRLFTRIYGVSPIVYLHQTRIQKAKEMLLSEYVSISNVAQTIGYANIYDFSRTFKKHTGQSPTQYLKNKRIPLENKK